jgi:hypothetical protein
MDKEQMDNSQHIERYLQGALSAEERARFEEEFLSSQPLLDELEAAEKLQQGLQDLAALEQARKPEKRPSGFMTLFNSPHYAMAASFFLVVSLGVSGVLLQGVGRVGDPDPLFSAVPTQITPLVSVRGAGSDPSINTIRLGDKQQNHVMMIDPGFGAYSHYRTTVYRQGSSGPAARIWQVDEMQPGYEDMLALSLPGLILEPGSFEVRVEGWRSEWPTGHDLELVDTVTFNCIE